MQPIAATAGTARRGASLAALATILLMAPAQAGDRALIDYLGYSEDGRYFAFEEYGVQDGSGFPYANLYIVDLPADAWVTGSPYRIVLQSEDDEVEDAREAAYEQAEAKLDELGIGGGVDVAAHHGDGEGGDAQSLTYGRPGYGLGEPQDVHELELETFAAESPEFDCEALIGDPALGFALFLDGEELHRDEGDLPRSRACPMGYRIHAVVMPPVWLWEVEAPVAVIATYPFGFEGPDRRFLVVPLAN